MKVVAVSGANIRHNPRGTSVLMAKRMVEIVQSLSPSLQGEVIPLVDKRLEPCVGCGYCADRGHCVIDDDFCSIYEALKSADALIFVAPHYAPIPAKLCALLERVESIAFLNRWRDKSWPSPLRGKPTALVGHGGAAGEDLQRFYRDVVLVPLKNALGYPVEAKIVTVEEWPYIGVVTGPSRVEEGGVFPIQHYDWPHIDRKLMALSRRLVEEVGCKCDPYDMKS